MEFKFTDFSKDVIENMNTKAIAFLEEAKSSIASQASRNSPVDTGALKSSFQTDSFVDEGELTAYIGSSLEYAIWQEYGTGERALNGNGRKGGWAFKGKDGKFHFTRGNKPRRMLYKAFQIKKSAVIKRGEELFKEI